MTKKQIVNTIGWTVIVFAILASYRYYIGVDNWVEETLNWVIPAAVGISVFHFLFLLFLF